MDRFFGGRSYSNNSRLQNKFSWVSDKEYKANRSANVIKYKGSYIGNRVIGLIPHLTGYKRTNGLSISNVDIFILASAKILEIPVLTDDPDMIDAAEEYEIAQIKTIEFLAYLYANNEIDSGLVLTIFDFWEYNNDPPTGYKAERMRYFPTL